MDRDLDLRRGFAEAAVAQLTESVRIEHGFQARDEVAILRCAGHEVAEQRVGQAHAHRDEGRANEHLEPGDVGAVGDHPVGQGLA